MTDAARSQRRGLGRGLDSLLTTPSMGSAELLIEVDPGLVVANPEQPRRTFADEELRGLADSIRTHGMLQPIVLEACGDERYQLVAGERRLRAARLAGLRRIPAILRPPSESGRQALELALTENLLREDLPPLEEAAAFSRLSDAFGLSHESIAARFGRSRSAVTNAVRLLGLGARVQQLLSEGSLSAGHARALLAVGDPHLQERLAEQVVEGGLTVRATEELVARTDGQAPRSRRPRSRAALSPDDHALQCGFESALGTPVRLQRRGRGGGGCLIIDFHSDEDLSALYQRLGAPPL